MTVWFWIITRLECTQQQFFFIKASYYFFLQDKIVKLQTHDLSFFLVTIFLVIIFCCCCCFQNMFVDQPILDTSKSRKGKGIVYILSWKSNGMYTSEFKPLYTAFLLGIKLSGYRMGISCRTKQLLDQSCKCLHCP